MSFPDPPPPPHFMPPPFASGDIGGFWPQIEVNNEDLDSHSQFEYTPSFKRPRNSINNSSNSSPFQPMNNPRMNPTNPPMNKGTGHIFYKTRMCLRFLDGACRNGEHCTFAHGVEDLREPPPNWQEIVAAREKDKGLGNWNNDDQRIITPKMKICKFYNGEECPYGDKCTFLHEPSPRESSAISIGTMGPVMGLRSGSDQPEMMNNTINATFDASRANIRPVYWKTKLCSKWEMGQCPYGERCHFAHGLSDLQAPGGRIEIEAVNNTFSIPTKPVPVLATDVMPPSRTTTVVTAHAIDDGKSKKGFSKWKGPKKINRIYADWIDDMTPPRILPSKAETDFNPLF